LVIWGEPHTGKTKWARSLGTHGYWNGKNGAAQQRDILKDIEYAIFDDIAGGIKYFPDFKGWLGAQEEITLKKMYHGESNVEWGKPSIWVSNHDIRKQILNLREMDDEERQALIDWVEASCIIVHIDKPFYWIDEEMKEGLKRKRSVDDVGEGREDSPDWGSQLPSEGEEC